MNPALRRAVAVLASVATLATMAPTQAFAQPAPTPSDARAEARDRFDRGLRLFNDGDNAGALAEFKRAYDLIPNPLVLYNIGLVYAVMGRPVESVDALDRVLADPASLSPDRRERARQTRDEQAQRVAQLVVSTEVPATIELDGVEAGKTPMTQPLRVAGGVHFVGAIATGYAPARKEVTVASGEKADVHLELIPMQGRLAHVEVKTHLPHADVFVDGQLDARTPLTQSLTLAPGPHTIEVRRAGYQTARSEVTLGDGATGEVTLEPAEDAVAIATSGASLSLELSESHANVTVDGQPRGIYSGALRLAPGPHLLLVERGGFEPIARGVDLPPGRTTTLRLVLEPTPEWRASYVSKATTQRTWGWVSMVAGLAIVGAGVGFLAWNQGQENSANADAVRLRQALNTNAPPCTFSSGGNAAQVCSEQITNDNNAVASDAQRVWVGYVAVGVGAAATGFGVYLLLSNDDVHRYDRPAAPPATGANVLPFGWTMPGGGGLGIRGTL